MSDLVTVLRSKKVEYFNQPVNDYKTQPKVMDDILAQLEHEKVIHKLRPKSYGELEHDIVLWHFVRDKRPPTVESPLHAKYFIVTVDYSFLGFDAFKRRTTNDRIQLCIHPASLIELLQFWLPRSPKFEEAVLGSLRLRFLLQEFDPQAEQVTLRILEALSRFEDVGDLPVEVLTSILLNQALRQKLAVEKSVEKQISLVRDALVESSVQARSKLKEAEEEAANLRQKLTEQETTIEALRSSVAQREADARNTQIALEDERGLRHSIELRVTELEKKLDEEAAVRVRRRHIAQFLFASGAMFTVVLVPVLNLFWNIFSLRWKSSVALSCLLFLGWIWFVDQIGLKDPQVFSWQPFAWFHRLKRRIYYASAAIAFGIVAMVIYDWWKNAN